MTARQPPTRSTPKSVVVLILCLLIVDLALGGATAKQLVFPYTKTTGEYLLWIGRILSLAVQYVLLPASIVITVLIAFLTRRKIRKLDYSSLAQPIVDSVAATLDKPSVALLTLAVEVVAFIAFVVVLALPIRPLLPPPPSPGLVVITKSKTIYRVVQNAVAIYDKDNFSSPLQVLQLSDASGIVEIAVSWDDKQIYAADPDNGLVRILETSPRLRETTRLNVGKGIRALALSGDGRKLYVAVVGKAPVWGAIHVIDTDKRVEVKVIANLGCPVWARTSSRAPLLFVVTQCGADNDPLYIIDTRTDAIKERIPGFAVGSRVIATAGGETAIVTSGYPDKLTIVRNPTANPDATTRPLQVSAMALTFDERLLLIGTQDRGWRIQSVDLATGDVCAETGLLEAEPVAIAIDPDGTFYVPMPARLYVGDSRALECS